MFINSNLAFTIIQIDESINILTNYFSQFKSDELKYYLNFIYCEKKFDIHDFFRSNIFDESYIQLKDFINDYLLVIINKFKLFDKLMLINNIKISFITDLIYFEDIFIIYDTIYINYGYILRMYDFINENKYNLSDKIYVHDDKFYSIELLKKLSNNIIFIIQYLNKIEWTQYLNEEMNYLIIDKYHLIFKEHNYIQFKNPNISWLDKFVPIININGTNYCAIDQIINSDTHEYSPYYETVIYKIDSSNVMIKTDVLLDIDANPFNTIANNLTNKLFLN